MRLACGTGGIRLPQSSTTVAERTHSHGIVVLAHPGTLFGIGRERASPPRGTVPPSVVLFPESVTPLGVELRLLSRAVRASVP